MEKKSENPLACLQVIDRLEIGPVVLEKKRLIAPYSIIQNDQKSTMDFIYSYEEEIFSPSEAMSQNLANIISAQIALNYGLFCKSIIFHGDYDESDRRFLRDMAENTAREIYVKKFLEPNPFLIGEAKEIPVIKKKRYCQASLKFPDVKKFSKSNWQLWSSDNQRYSILSSGGKDSLLTYGLLNEIGCEVHPIYLNESGRHWFTALNSHRYFKENVPNTAKVWVNSDRLFAWFLRHLPFIRPDFANIRSDEYPIRLWTVGVFLFGALPLLRKRGIGRILIGDEFDTTNKTRTEGITHYDGLYDQSLYFDNEMSRYFLKKGWAISQFSILRPLSEMLIQNILVKRYPHLQQHQVSCHSAHKEEEEERVHPCGKCEKCRRIIAMLKAIDADPQACGYSAEQIKESLASLIKKGVHQEEKGIQQLYFMLAQKGIITTSEKVKEQKSILQLRFDNEHSPMNNIPVALRAPLYKIYLEYAQGAIRKKNKTWKSFDLLSDPDLQAPYTFDLSEPSSATNNSDQSENYLWAEMTWKEAEERFKKTDIALLPVGAIEQHGPHLPLDTDAYDAKYLAHKVAESCSSPKPLVLPDIAYGVSYHHDNFKGTLSISNDTLAHLVYDIGVSAARNGIKKLIIINGHGGNSATLNHAAQMINRDTHILVCVDTGETSDVDIYKLIDTPNDIHAGEVETSTTLAIRPHLVKMDLAEPLVPEFSNRYLDFTSNRGISWHAYTETFSSNGVMGDPTKATAEKGQKIWQIMISHLVTLIENLKGLTLEEIYQHRY